MEPRPFGLGSCLFSPVLQDKLARLNERFKRDG